MDKRLALALRNKEFYTAHQYLISTCQRLERAGKVKEASDVLEEGIIAIDEAGAPDATISDLVQKYTSILAQAYKSSSKDTVQLNTSKASNVLRSVSKRTGAHWQPLAYCAVKQLNLISLEECFQAIDGAKMDDLATFTLAQFPQEIEQWNKITLEGQGLLNTGLYLLSGKFFLSLQALVASADSNKDNRYEIQEESSFLDQVCARNLLILLSELLKRSNPPRELFVQLQVRYATLLTDATTKEAWNAVKDVYWPKKVQPTIPANNLASMFQSMMSSSPSLR